jgi:predicted  nucleic acid-binding Zn-ribbon protein
MAIAGNTVLPVAGGASVWFGLEEWRRCKQLFERYTSLHQKLEKTLSEHQRRYPMQVKLGELEGQIKESEGQLQSLKSTLDRFEDKSRELEFVTRQVETLREQESALEARFKEIRQKELQHDRLTGAFDRLQEEHDGLVDERSSLEGAVQALRKEEHDLELALRKVQEQYAEVEEKRRELLRLEEDKRKIEEAVRKLQAEHETLERDCDNLKRDAEEYKAILARGHGDLEHALKAFQQDVLIKRPGIKASQTLDEQQFIDRFKVYLEAEDFVFPARLVEAFHTSLKIQDISSLLVLAGISGTGKSELPRLYANFAHLDFVMLPVQPRWDSPQDLLGFYNYMEKQYKPTRLAQALRQVQEESYYQDRLVLVLLDEMNLARVEYYFSDFLSKLEARRNSEVEAFVELDFGNLALADGKKRLKLLPNVLYVGTMNEDETTQTLSDKVLDRASVITFPRPTKLQMDRGISSVKAQELDGYLSRQTFEQWSRNQLQPDDPLCQKVAEILALANDILAKVDRPFGHRVSQAVMNYVQRHPSVMYGTDPERYTVPLADQFALKIISKLRGLPLDDRARETLQDFKDRIVTPLHDPLLSRAFSDALPSDENAYAFAWRGLPYEVASQPEPPPPAVLPAEHEPTIEMVEA